MKNKNSQRAITTKPIIVYNEERAATIPKDTEFDVWFNPDCFYSKCKGLEIGGLKTNVICNNSFEIIT